MWMQARERKNRTELKRGEEEKKRGEAEPEKRAELLADIANGPGADCLSRTALVADAHDETLVRAVEIEPREAIQA